MQVSQYYLQIYQHLISPIGYYRGLIALLYKRIKKEKKKENPYRMLANIRNSFISQFKSIRVIDLSIIKVSIQVTNFFKIPFTLNIRVRYCFITLLKALIILKNSSNTILPFIYQTVYTQLTKKSKAVFINCFFQAPIWQANSILYSFAIQRIYFTITAFIILLTVFNNNSLLNI